MKEGAALVARPVVVDEERREIAADKMLGLSPTVDYRLADGAPAAVASADAIAVFHDGDDDEDAGTVTAPPTQPAAPAVTLPSTGVGPAAPATGTGLGAVPGGRRGRACALLMRQRRAVGSN